MMKTFELKINYASRSRGGRFFVDKVPQPDNIGMVSQTKTAQGNVIILNPGFYIVNFSNTLPTNQGEYEALTRGVLNQANLINSGAHLVLNSVGSLIGLLVVGTVLTIEPGATLATVFYDYVDESHL